MKQILFFLLFAKIAAAQTITKEYVLGSDNETYFEIVTITQDDESAVTTKTLVGPASSLAGDQADKIEATTRELSAQAFAVSKVNGRINEIGATDATILALTTVSPLKVIQERYAAALTALGWTIDRGDGNGFVSLVFTINGQNNLRYSIAGSATKAATVYGDIITLGGFPSTGTNTEFYLNETGLRYFSLPNRAAQIKKLVMEPRTIAIILAIILAALFVFRNNERDRLLEWFDGLEDSYKSLIGAAFFLAATILFTWLTAPIVKKLIDSF